MNNYYKDITSKIAEEPQWFDEHAVPRYCRFSPRKIADIYANECALVLIACQSCGTEFRVAFSQDTMDVVKWTMMFGKDKTMPTIADQIRDKTLHYGDPPNMECCPAGPTMSSEPHKVLQYWKRERLDWKRDKTLEIGIEPDWVIEI